MAKITPIQVSFSAGEISPLMYNRTDTKGYKAGLAEMTNMFPDSRGPAYSRGGTRHISSRIGNDARIMAIPVNDEFFYSGIFLENKLLIGSMVGHNPSVVHSDNANFNQGSTGWIADDDGNANSSVIFSSSTVNLTANDGNNDFALIKQQFTVPNVNVYRISWNLISALGVDISIGTTEGGNDVYSSIGTTISVGDVLFTAPQTTLWLEARVNGTNQDEGNAIFNYLGIIDELTTDVEFVTPYLESELEGLQGAVSPEGAALYVLHERHPVYKLTYDRNTDSFAWDEVSFVGKPPEWANGSYPSSGDFFEGRLWLGGTINEPQTFWASKSGLPEDFTQGVNADDGLEFTMAKYGRIEWMVGFKNLVIGTQNGEHIVTSAGGFIKPDDIKVEQQSSYGSANVQPVQVGDQIFYVSADGRKLRAIQYEWQKDNWLSKDLTFNSEHITNSGIRHITWQQNPKNLFHCVLNDGTTGTLTYERSQDVYGWSKIELGGSGKILDATTGPINGTDYINMVVQYVSGEVYFETQAQEFNVNYMDSWVERNPQSDGITILGLEHLEGETVQVLVDNATTPDKVVLAGEITLDHAADTNSKVVVGLQYTPALTTLPINQMMQSGGSEPYMKRWNKVFIRVLASTMPLINGERSPERFPLTPMNTPQLPIDQEILKINLGFNRNEVINIEQDLPHRLIVLGIYGELGQSIL